MAISLIRPGSAAGTDPAEVMCSAGRWVTHDEWPGWQRACSEPGMTCPLPPYVLCTWHTWDLAERCAAELHP